MEEEKRPNQVPEDDGRTIARMNVEGMPWYMPPGPDAQEKTEGGYEMTKEERGAYIWAAVRAGLLIFLVFSVVFFLFLLFCTQIWLK